MFKVRRTNVFYRLSKFVFFFASETFQSCRESLDGMNEVFDELFHRPHTESNAELKSFLDRQKAKFKAQTRTKRQWLTLTAVTISVLLLPFKLLKIAMQIYIYIFFRVGGNIFESFMQNEGLFMEARRFWLNCKGLKIFLEIQICNGF